MFAKSIPTRLAHRRQAGGRGAPFRLPPQVGSGNDLGQDAQPQPQGLPLLRCVCRRFRNLVRDYSAGLVPVDIAFGVSHHIPPQVTGSIACRTRTLPFSLTGGGDGTNPL